MKARTGRLLDPLAAVQVHVGHPVVDLEDDKVGQAGDHRLHPLAEQELLQIVVAQGGELHIDLAHHAHADLGLALDGDGGEVAADLVKEAAHLAPAHALARLEAVHQLLGPGVDHGVGLPLVHFIGADLVGHVDDNVPVHHGIHRLADEGEGQGEAGVLLQAGQVDGHHGDVGHVRLLQGLAQQVDVVGGPAAAARLGDEQAHLVGVISPVLHRVDELTDDQQGGVAGVVVDVLEPLIHDPPVVGGEHVHLVARRSAAASASC